jgi:2-oxoglutarate dehydrogenase E1 component
MALHLPQVVGRPIGMVSRPASSAPASGSAKAHAAEQAAVVDGAFARNS